MNTFSLKQAAILLTFLPTPASFPSMKPATTAFIFPGQGSQTPGMGAAFMAFSATKDVFEEVDDALHVALSSLMQQGPAETLTQTENAQPALLTVGYAAARCLEKQAGKPLSQLCAMVAGHSLGEYTAVTAAGGMSVAQGAALVRLRGQAMSQAVPAGQGGQSGGMSAVLNLSLEQLDPIAKAAGVTVANDNAPGQLILSGPIAALEQAEEAARAAGAKRVLRLGVSGPFHTAAMQPAAHAVFAALAQSPLQPLAMPCSSNAHVTAAQDADTVSTNLIDQITQRVRWREQMTYLADQGITHVVELGVGKVLTGLAPRCDARLTAISVTTPEEVDNLLTQLLN